MIYPYSAILPMQPEDWQVQTMVKPEQVIESVLKVFNITIHDICTRRRFQRLVQPRYVAMHLLYTYTEWTLKDIGTYFGNYDHSSVIHGLTEISNFIDTGHPVSNKLYKCIELLHS